MNLHKPCKKEFVRVLPKNDQVCFNFEADFSSSLSSCHFAPRNYPPEVDKIQLGLNLWFQVLESNLALERDKSRSVGFITSSTFSRHSVSLFSPD